MISDGETKQYVEQRLAEVSQDLENKYKPMQMRIRALEFASCMYINDNGNKGDTKAEGFIAFANEVYKYIKEGKSNA